MTIEEMVALNFLAALALLPLLVATEMVNQQVAAQPPRPLWEPF